MTGWLGLQQHDCLPGEWLLWHPQHAVQSPGALVASSLCFTRLSWLPMFLFVHGSKVIVAAAGIAGLSICRALVD